MTRMSVMPALTASSTTYWIAGLSTRGSISLGWAFVAGRKRVPKPAAGITALRTVEVGSVTDEAAYGLMRGSPAPADVDAFGTLGPTEKGVARTTRSLPQPLARNSAASAAATRSAAVVPL